MHELIFNHLYLTIELQKSNRLRFALRRPHLAELHAALVQDALDEQLEEAVPAGPEARLAQLAVGGDELGHHGAALLEAVDARRAGVPVLELGVVGEPRQREQQTQLAVVLPAGAVVLQGVQAAHRLLHAQLQLTGDRRKTFGLKGTYYTSAGCKFAIM